MTSPEENLENEEPLTETFFNPDRGVLDDHGVIRIPMGGFGSEGIWDGYLTIKPDHGDFEFWKWILRKWPYSSSLSERDLPLLRQEFQMVRQESV